MHNGKKPTLQAAAYAACILTAELFVESGAPLGEDETWNWGLTPLQVATRTGSFKLVQRHMRVFDNANAPPDHDGCSVPQAAVEAAMAEDQLEIVERLLFTLPKLTFAAASLLSV